MGANSHGFLIHVALAYVEHLFLCAEYCRGIAICVLTYRISMRPAVALQPSVCVLVCIAGICSTACNGLKWPCNAKNIWPAPQYSPLVPDSKSPCATATDSIERTPTTVADHRGEGGPFIIAVRQQEDYGT
jgi:hypothetical protein